MRYSNCFFPRLSRARSLSSRGDITSVLESHLSSGFLPQSVHALFLCNDNTWLCAFQREVSDSTLVLQFGGAFVFSTMRPLLKRMNQEEVTIVILLTFSFILFKVVYFKPTFSSDLTREFESYMVKPIVQHYELEEGMQLQVNLSESSNGYFAKVELQLRNCSGQLVLHWGVVYTGMKNWVLPADHPTGTRVYKQNALQTPFMKTGQIHFIVIHLRDSKANAIEFVIKDERRDKWFKLNNGNFRVDIPKDFSCVSQSVMPKELVELKAYLIWESKGKPRSSPQQQKEDYEAAVRELQLQLSRGISLDDIRSCLLGRNNRKTGDSKERSNAAYDTHSSSSLYYKRYDVSQWLNKHSGSSQVYQSTFLNLVDKSIGGTEVIQNQIFHVGNNELVVLLKMVRGHYHLLVATSMPGAQVLHWGVSSHSPGGWLVPPSEILPERSKLVDGACQTYFKELSTVGGSFKGRYFMGFSFIIWSDGSWIKNHGSNFSVTLTPVGSKCGKSAGNQMETLTWLVNEISEREKDAERSFMHRFNIATELLGRCRHEGELGMVAILVWFRFMACRQLKWNKNYNVKPREISEAQDKLTDLLKKIYCDQPCNREFVRLVMSCIGRGGQGDAGQRIRDEILLLQRNNDCKGGMMEEWHQKLHNNSSPDDVIICQALLDYVRSDFKLDAYWRTLNSYGLTKSILASYGRPIISEPRFRPDLKEGLIRDLTSYLRTLKAVHSGADLESAITACLGYSSKGHDFMSGVHIHAVPGLSLKLQESLNFIRVHIDDKSVLLVEKLIGARVELYPILQKPNGRLKDLLFLDLALDLVVRTCTERQLQGLTDFQFQDTMSLISLLLENSCLSANNNEDFIYCTKDWYRACELYKSRDGQWTLQMKAILDRIQLALAEKADYYQRIVQPTAKHLGQLLQVEKFAIDIFIEELIRAGCAPTLSLLVNHLDHILRKIAKLSCWQIISPVEVSGFVAAIRELISVQNKVYGRPTILIVDKVSGEEEIPDGVVGVVASSMPDILSHVSVRARNSKVCFAACFDQSTFRDLKSKDGKMISLRLGCNCLLFNDVASSDLSPHLNIFSSFRQSVTLKKKNFGGKFAISAEEFTSEMVGAKSRNVQYLKRRLPSWIRVPTSVAVPFGVFEAILLSDINKVSAKKVPLLNSLVDNGDLSKLHAIQELVLQLKAPPQLMIELKSKMKNSNIAWPGDEGEERWDRAWQAMKKVWASKWNERAYVSCRKAKLNHNDLCMAILVQEIICADYAFVMHTRNPLSGDPTEIYTEIVKGLGETLVGAHPGRAMSFITKKTDLGRSSVVSYPSKRIGLFLSNSIIFRSDSNGEDLEGYAGAGLYDSIPMDREKRVVLDYSCDRLVTDKDFQRRIFSKIAEVGKTVEGLFGSAQDIGVVKSGEIYVVQTRPQM